jgi:hypothetical protein
VCRHVHVHTFSVMRCRNISRCCSRSRLSTGWYVLPVIEHFIVFSNGIKAKCVDTLRQVVALVDSKAPGDAAPFKGWLRQISQHVAEAATEGGFLGVGGVAVSETEKATLAEISSAIGLQG